MTEAIESMSRWPLRLWKLDFGIIYCTGIKFQEVETLLHVYNKAEKPTGLDDVVPVFTVSSESLLPAASTVKAGLKIVEYSKGSFVPSLPVICIMAGLDENRKARVPTISEFTAAQFSSSDCGTTFESVEKPNTDFNVKCDGVLVCVSTFEGKLQQFVPATLRVHFLLFGTTTYWPAITKIVKCTDL